MKNYVFTAVIYRDDDKFFAECPDIGSESSGETIDEAISRLKEESLYKFEDYIFQNHTVIS